MRALIVVDVQNDFCEGGSLPVAGGADTALRISQFISEHADKYAVVVASKDFHSPHGDNGSHFALDGEPDYSSTWPAHCVVGTEGSEFHPNLVLTAEAVEVVYKGRGVPAYSAFEGRTSEGVGLDTLLRRHDVTKVDVVGIATDYCVKATAEDAGNSYNTTVLLDLTAAVGGEQGLRETSEALAKAGVWVLNTDLIDWKVEADTNG